MSSKKTDEERAHYLSCGLYWAIMALNTIPNHPLNIGWIKGQPPKDTYELLSRLDKILEENK